MSEPSRADERLSEAFVSLEGDADSPGPCPDPAEIWRALMGEVPASRARSLVEHSAGCGSCAASWRLARSIAGESGALPAAADKGRSGGRLASALRPGWLLAAAASILVVGAAVVLLGRGGGADPWRDLRITRAAYTRPVSPDDVVWRDSIGAAGAEEARLFTEAMRPYEDDDFAAAERTLTTFLQGHPGHARALLYHGVCLLMLGRPAMAIPSLEAAVLGEEPRVREDALWYLALACAKDGRRAEALERLRAIAAGSSERREEARRLLDRLAAGSADGAR